MIFNGLARPRVWLLWLLLYLGCVVSWKHIHSHDTWWTLTPEVLVVMAGVVLCFLSSSTGRRPVCAKYALCGPVMFTFSLGLARGSQKPMVVEMEVSLQVSFLSPCKSVFFMICLFWSDVVCRSQWWKLIYLLCMVLWWTLHHHDLWGTLLQKLCLTWFFSSVLDRHCYICSVWCLDEDTTMIVADRTLDAPFFSWRRPSDLLTACVSLCGFLINTSHCDVSRTLVSIPPRSSRHPLTNDNWHGGSHLRVSSVIEPVIVFVLRTAIFALCVHVMNTIPS